MADNFPRFRVLKVYDHRAPDEFLTLYDDEDVPMWVKSWEFYSYDDEEQLYVTEAFEAYCRAHRIPMNPPTPAALAAILRVAY